MSDDICECPKCGRQHRDLGFGKPPSIMEQIAHDIREGTFPKKSEATSEWQKRPVAFRVPRVVDGVLSATEWQLFSDEEAARAEAEAKGCDYQGLYARTA